MGIIRIFGPRDKPEKGLLVINTTSRSRDWGRELSPFLLGPVHLYKFHYSLTMENAWQYCKVYQEHLTDGEVNADYWTWAKLGWKNPRVVRYPMGKGAKPLFSLWNGSRLSYIQARREIYIPLYAECVLQTQAFQKLRELHSERKPFGLFDFDGYDYGYNVMSEGGFRGIIRNKQRKMGHAFVLAMMLEEPDLIEECRRMRDDH